MIYVLSGGGSGGTLVVTGVAGDTCTITNGTKTHTKTFDSNKKATFKGLATGTWTVKMTNGTKTVSRTVTITSDYTMTIAYFSSTIKITYPATSTCVVKDSSGNQVASDTNTSTNTKTWTVTVGAIDTYTITITATDSSGKTKSTTVSITADGQSKTATVNYATIIFDASGLVSAYSSGGGAEVTVETDSSGVKYLYFPSGGGYNRMAFLTPAVDLTEFSTLKINGFATAARKFGVWSATPDSDNKNLKASVTMAKGTTSTLYSLDVSNLTGSYYLGTQYATGDTSVYELYFE